MIKRFAVSLVAIDVVLFSAVALAATPDDHEQLVLLQQRVNEMGAVTAASSTRSHVVAVILLVGLFIEVVGALFLAGPALVAKQEDVFSLDATPGWSDLQIHDIGGEQRVNFLGTLGALLLALGFVVQFTGTIITLGISPTWTALLAVVAISGAAIIFNFLLGQSTAQSRSEKLAVLWRNFKRILPQCNVCCCDYCNANIGPDEAQVRWREAKRPEKYPFLYPPHRWHVGHAKCLDESPWYPPIAKLPGQAPEETKTATFDQFLSERGDREDYWARYVRDHNSKSPKPITSTPPEIEYRAVLRKVLARKTA
jgi:hypothetical protein